MKALHMITWILLVVGGLNWGLSVFGWDLYSWGLPEGLLSLVYVLVGVSALVEIFTHKGRCKDCNVGGSASANTM